MSLDSVNRLNQMMEILRRQMADSAGRAGSARTPAGKVEKQGAPSAKPGIQELRARVIERLASLDPADPRRSQKARRLFLESVLAWEFGSELLSDRRLDDVLDGIQQTISTDPELDARFSELLDEIGAK